MSALRAALSISWPTAWPLSPWLLHSLLIANSSFAAEAVRMPDIEITVKGMEAKTIGCAAAIKLDYQQRNTFARVNGTLENPTCPASSGSYDIVVTLRDVAGEAQTLTFNESWQRSDAGDVSFTHDYPIGDNTDLRRVTARGVTCSCTQAAE